MAKEIAIAQNWFSQNGKEIRIVGKTYTKSTKPTLKIQPLWDKATYTDREGLIIVEVPLQSQGRFAATTQHLSASLLTDRKDKLLNSTTRLIMEVFQGSVIGTHLMTIVADSSYMKRHGYSVEKNTYLYKMPDFTGFSIIKTLDGQFEHGEYYCNGKLSGTCTPEDLQVTKTHLKFSDTPECTRHTYTSYEQDCIYWYTNGRNTSSRCGEWYIVGESSFVTCPYTGHNHPSGGESGGTPPVKPKLEVDTKDSSFKDTKADCVFQKLVGSTSTNIYDPNSVVGKLLKDYWGKTSAGAHYLTFVVSPQCELLNNETHAQCESDSKYGSNNVIIRISSKYMASCTNVEMARTLIHESIHAEIYIREQGVIKGISPDSDFATLFDKYKTYGGEKDHNVMAESDYVKLIADGLKAYHDAGYMADFDANVSKNACYDFTIPKFFEFQAWIGLDHTKVFEINYQNSKWKANYDTYNKAPTTFGDIKNCK